MRATTQGVYVSSIKKLNGKVIISRERVIYDDNNINKYLEYFQELKKKGIILTKDFSYNSWNLTWNYDGVISNTTLDFPFEINNFFNNSLKCFCIDKLRNKNSIGNVSVILKAICNGVLASNMLNSDYLGEFEDFLDGLADEPLKRYLICVNLYNYIKYINLQNTQLYIDIINNYRVAPERNVRKLPEYKSILYFDYFINRFNREYLLKEIRKKYLPIIFWWKLSAIIPMRPIEFIRLKKEGCFKKEGNYYITIKREKVFGFEKKALGTKKIQTLGINEEIFNLAQECINQLNNNGKYILSVEALAEYKTVIFSKIKYELIDYHRFYILLDEFYSEVIEAIYGFKSIKRKDLLLVNDNRILTRVLLGDTRHLAILNLVIQGYNPLTIKHIAGHERINSHMHYYDHVDSYIQSQTLVLTDAYIELISKESMNIDKMIFNQKLNNIRQESSNQSDVFYIEEGWCTRYKEMLELYPDLCIGSCNQCDYHILDYKNYSLSRLKDEVSSLDEEIKNKFEVLKVYVDYARNIIQTNKIKEDDIDKEKGFSDKQMDIQVEGCSKSAGNNIAALIRQKSKNMAYIKLKKDKDEK